MILHPEVYKTNMEALSKQPNARIVCIDNVCLKQIDISLLVNGGWLNDNVVDAYLKLIQIEHNSMNPSNPVKALPTCFFTKLESLGYNSVRSYTRQENLFAQRFLFIPIYFSNRHWGLVVADMPRQKIVYLDSDPQDRQDRGDCILGQISEYLHKEYVVVNSLGSASHSRPLFRTSVSQKMPAQHNGSDCGVFLCVAADYLAKNRIPDFTQEDMPYFRQRIMFELIKAARFNA
jgi:Ulp1 family protease